MQIFFFNPKRVGKSLKCPVYNFDLIVNVVNFCSFKKLSNTRLPTSSISTALYPDNNFNFNTDNNFDNFKTKISAFRMPDDHGQLNAIVTCF